MEQRAVYVIFIEGGKVDPTQIIRGATVMNENVFVVKWDKAILHQCVPAVSENYVIVDLDADDHNRLPGNEELIIDLICGTNKWGRISC